MLIGPGLLLSMANLFYRDCLNLGCSPFDLPFANAAMVSVMVLLTAWSWFRRREFDFAESI